MLFRALRSPTKDFVDPRSGTWTVRNIMQHSPTCEEDPALPGLFTLTRPTLKNREVIFQS